MRSRLLACILATGLFASGCSTSSTSGTAPTGAPASTGGAVQFLSTQYNTVDETTKVRDAILKNAPVQSQFQPSELGPFNDRVTAEQKRVLTEAAERTGLDVSAWLRVLGLREAAQKREREG